ncbi:hypothetical protein L2E82_27772 [Cichorium intybus]|uniref:Uncharacterized protein n=1 Tax=Cichorium intybus TaxID=13427 RepID=A0ACB9CU06_CICIN|nr:hypothetical protein L2E82_27772 [Cichorium intybus]
MNINWNPKEKIRLLLNLGLTHVKLRFGFRTGGLDGRARSSKRNTRSSRLNMIQQFLKNANSNLRLASELTP